MADEPFTDADTDPRLRAARTREERAAAGRAIRAERAERARAQVNRARGDAGDDFGPLSAGDVDELRRRAKSNPANANPARTSRPRSAENAEADDELPDVPVPARPQPASKASEPKAAKRAPGRRPVPVARRAFGNVRAVATGRKVSGAGFVMGFLLYAVGLNFLRGGPTEAWAWVKAKFVNDTGQGAGGGVSSTSSAQTSAANASSGGNVAAGIVPGATISPSAAQSALAPAALVSVAPAVGQTPTTPAVIVAGPGEPVMFT